MRAPFKVVLIPEVAASLFLLPWSEYIIHVPSDHAILKQTIKMIMTTTDLYSCRHFRFIKNLDSRNGKKTSKISKYEIFARGFSETEKLGFPKSQISARELRYRKMESAATVAVLGAFVVMAAVFQSYVVIIAKMVAERVLSLF